MEFKKYFFIIELFIILLITGCLERGPPPTISLLGVCSTSGCNFTGDINMNGHIIRNVTLVNVTMEYVVNGTSTFVNINVTGNTSTGMIFVNGDIYNETSLGYTNVRCGIYSGISPRCVFDYNGVAATIDNGGLGPRLFVEGSSKVLRIFTDKVQVGDTFNLMNMSVFGDLNGTTVSGNQLKSYPLGSPPGTCNGFLEGGVYYDKDVHKLCVCNSTSWKEIDSLTICT